MIWNVSTAFIIFEKFNKSRVHVEMIIQTGIIEIWYNAEYNNLLTGVEHKFADLKFPKGTP